MIPFDLEVFDPRDRHRHPRRARPLSRRGLGFGVRWPHLRRHAYLRQRLRVLLYDHAPQGRPLHALYSRRRLSPKLLQGNFVTLTNLTDEDVQNVIQRNMSPMNVSVHAVSPDVRRRMMGRNAQRGMDVLETIMAAGIEIHAQIVLCPGMNDGEELEKTLRFCEEHEQITSLGIVPLGFTKHQNRFSWSYSDKPELARETIA